MKKITPFFSAFLTIVILGGMLVGSIACGDGPVSEVVNCTITYDANGGTISSDAETVPIGGRIVLPSAKRISYIFLGWFTDPSAGTKIGGASDGFQVNESITLYAQWEMSDWYEEYLVYPYERGESQYYVCYEIRWYINGFLADFYVDNAYFDTFATAWAFAHSGGPNPTPVDNQMVWIDGINRFWAIADPQESYEVVVVNHHSEEILVYFESFDSTMQGTYYAPDQVFVEMLDGISGYINGTPLGNIIIKDTLYTNDPGYFGWEDVTVIESWWSTIYAGWIYGEPDYYTIEIVPVTDVIYSCR
ncbi:MAG: InlB B-repeat-containing protein [Dehalococcoidia bacterium]|nr:InlB B-repeat-containing protein [Dehalococcoidia bacterium]